MSIPAVSICITTYNVDRYISRTLDSVCNQVTDFPFEIIIGDDFSNDETRNIIIDYKKRFPNIITLVLHDENIGVLKNDISLINVARADYIAWCDGDDWWSDNNKLQMQYNIIKNDEVSLVHTDWDNFYENSNTFERVSIIPSDIEKHEFGLKIVELFMLDKSSGLRFSSCMFKKYQYIDVLKKFPMLFHGHLSNDLAVFVGLANYGKFQHIPISTTVYTIRAESLSKTNNVNKRSIYLQGLFNLLINISKYYKIDKNVKYISIKRIFDGILYYYYKNNIFDNKNIVLDYKNLGYKLTIGQKFLLMGASNKKLAILFQPIFFFNNFFKMLVKYLE